MIRLFSYKLKRNIELAISQEDEVCVIDKKRKKILLQINNCDENIFLFFSEIIVDEVYDLEDLNNRYNINPMIIKTLKKKSLLNKRLRIMIDLPYLKNIRIKNANFLINILYIPFTLIGFSLMNANTYVPLSPLEVLFGITSSLFIHEVGHILVANEIGNVNKVSLMLLPLSLCTETELDDFDNSLEVLSAGIKLQLLVFGVENIIAVLMICLNSPSLWRFFKNISSINLAIAIINLLNINIFDVETDGSKIMELIYNKNNEFKSTPVLRLISSFSKFGLIVIELLGLFVVIMYFFK